MRFFACFLITFDTNSSYLNAPQNAQIKFILPPLEERPRKWAHCFENWRVSWPKSCAPLGVYPCFLKGEGRWKWWLKRRGLCSTWLSSMVSAFLFFTYHRQYLTGSPAKVRMVTGRNDVSLILLLNAVNDGMRVTRLIQCFITQGNARMNTLQQIELIMSASRQCC